jgi:ATP-binding cassette, subfamily B, bacterial
MFRQFQQSASISLAFIRRSLGFIREASGKWMLAWAAVLVCSGVLPAASVFLMKRVVDALARSIGAGTAWTQASAVLVPSALLLAVMIAQRALSAIGEWVNTVQSQLVQDHIKSLIHAKAASIDYGFFESPDYHDQMHQANSQAGTRILSLLATMGSLGQSTITFVSISMILIRYSAWLPVVLLVTSGPAFYLLLKENRRHHSWWQETTPDRRRSVYLDAVLTSQFSAAEVRLNDLGEYFTDKYRQLVGRMRNEELTLKRQRIAARIGAGFIGMIVTGAAVLWIGRRALRGRATLGDLALFYQAFNQGQSLAGGLLSGMGDIHTSVLYLEQVFEYLDKPNVIEDPAAPVPFPSVVRQGVEFHDVSFTYDGSEHPAVERLNLRVPAGKIVALVGANGSGKSTLIKLLCRFYDPGAGRVTIDGTDLRRFGQQELRRQIAVMMQFPVKYHLSVAENILVGDLASVNGGGIERAARGAGAHEFIARLPHGYETLLGRTFKDSTELSGGEWQRLALARAFLRQAQIVVLDEPTSFMDSWNEHEWLQRFRGLVERRTALIITHRFTTAMQADIIHVMDRGRIVESGTHGELLDLGGKYAESWMEQMKARNDGAAATVVGRA